MTAGNSFDAEPTLFSALLTPHRSLSRSGFLLLMGFIVLISFIAGLVFLSMGAWPVFGFFGLDALAIYWAFKVNFHRAAAYEEIAVTPSAVHVRRVTHLGPSPNGPSTRSGCGSISRPTRNLAWNGLSLVSRGRSLGIASFLGPDEKQSFAKALTAALNSAKRGVDYNPVT